MIVLTEFPPPSEGIKHEQPSTKLFVSGREIGCGTLYISESNFFWRNNTSGQGYSLLYPQIAVHAVSRDIERFGSECLFIMVDDRLDDMEMNEEEEDNENGRGMTEMRFVPDDKGQLEAMYQAMNYCQGLHPDPQDEFSEDEIFWDADGIGDGIYTSASSGNNTIDRSNGAVQNQGDQQMETDGQFEDAEDD